MPTHSTPSCCSPSSLPLPSGAHSFTLRNPTGLSRRQSPFGQSSFVGKENGTPAETQRGSEGPETTIPQSFPWRRRRRMPLPNNDAAGYDDSYYVMRHSSLHGWFKSPCERAMHYRVVVSALTPELKMRKGIHPKMYNTQGFLYPGHSNWTICGLLSRFCS